MHLRPDARFLLGLLITALLLCVHPAIDHDEVAAQGADPADVVARVAPSIVQITTNLGLGSGVAVPEGILTNEHVVCGAAQVEVRSSDGRVGTASVVRADPKFDLALLRTDLALPVVESAPAQRQHPGETILVLGYPYGIGGQATISRGLMSPVRQDEAGVLWVQTDAAMNPGNSGGAVVNMDAN
jgi:S1-C subfamily serine protease